MNCQICSRQISGSYGYNDMGDKICSTHSDAILRVCVFSREELIGGLLFVEPVRHRR